MNDLRWLDVIRREGTAFAAYLDTGPLDARVPGCPDWDLAAMAAHLGDVHRNVTRTVNRPADERMEWLSFPPPADDGELSGWLRDGLEEMLAALAGDPDDLVSTFVGPRLIRWWWRRQAQENLLHRWDAESAIGTPTPLDPELAVDGIDELFEVFLPRKPVERFGADGSTAHLHAIDAHGEWLLTFDADVVRVEREHRKGDVAARGTASDLLLFLYGRVPASRLDVFGDETVLRRWQAAADI